MFYRLMAVTGFRKKEAASLTREDFTNESGELVVHLAAKSAKNRRRDRKVIPAGQASRTRKWLASKAPGELLFPLPSKFSKSLRRDMAAARQAWIDDAEDETDRKAREASDFLRYVNSAGLFADNHSFRALYCTTALRVSGNQQTLLAASRHSDVEVARRYWHSGQDEFAALQHRIGEQLQPSPSLPAGASPDARQCAVQCATDEAPCGTNGHVRAPALDDAAGPITANAEENHVSPRDPSMNENRTRGFPNHGSFSFCVGLDAHKPVLHQKREPG